MFEEILQILQHQYFIAPAIIIGLGFVAYFVTKKYLTGFLNKLICRGDENWQQIFEDKKPFRQLNFLAPVLFISFGLQYLPEIADYANRVIGAYVILNLSILINAVANTFVEIYQLYPISKERPIKSYVQMAGIFIYLLGAILAICILLDKEVTPFIASMGGITAILMLVFRDTILSFIAGMQILGNNLIRKGDWIEVPSFGANGAVIDVALHVIKVQNWDKTVVTIPTYKVIESGFKNWRGMYDAGGRRIKRSLLIDQTSVSFLDRDTLKALSKTKHIKKYMEDFLVQIQEGADESEADLWEVTNLGVFRRYVQAYLHSHPKINTNLSFMIRLLEPTAEGIPLELYIFTKDTVWAKHESVQSEIFEHFMAVMPVFGLRLFQNPTGYDVQQSYDVGLAYLATDREEKLQKALQKTG